MAYLSVHTWHRWCYKRYKKFQKKHDKGHQLKNFCSSFKGDDVERQNQSSFWSPQIIVWATFIWKASHCIPPFPTQSHLLGDLTEVPLPVRFIYLLLGPADGVLDYHEIGRAMATLMSDKVSRRNLHVLGNWAVWIMVLYNDCTCIKQYTRTCFHRYSIKPQRGNNNNCVLIAVLFWLHS